MSAPLFINNSTQLPTNQKNPETKKTYGLERVEVIIRKCSCSHSWCPRCGTRKGDFREALAVIMSWPFDRIRHVTVTTDPKKFNSPSSAWAICSRAISDFSRDLGRRLTAHNPRLHILSYVAFTEFHRDGFPHWHIFFLVDLVGADGRIGWENIRGAWPHGQGVWEQPFRTEGDKERMVGYAQKTGYLHKDKSHQTTLPSWALKTTTMLRRVRKSQSAEDRAKELRALRARERDGFSYGPGLTPQERDAWAGVQVLKGSRLEPKESATRRTNEEVIRSCGNAIQLVTASVLANKREPDDHGFERRWRDKLLSYELAKRLPGYAYVPGRGLIKEMALWEFWDFYGGLQDAPWESKDLGGAV